MTRHLPVPLGLVLVSALVALPGCVDLVGAMDDAKYVDRQEKTFTVAGRPDVILGTFDGSIEIRPTDKSEVHVVIEKHAASKEDADKIQIQAEQTGNRVVVEVKKPESLGGIHFGWSRSAKLIVSLPASSNVQAHSGDGSIDIERITGTLELRSGDGSIRGRDLIGDVKAHTGDGSIKLDDVTGTLDADTGDGSVAIGGKLSVVRARSGDGSVEVRASAGSAASTGWDITTGDGSITLIVPEGFGGELDAHSGDGHVALDGVSVSNVTGQISRNSVKGRLGQGGGPVRLRTGDGSITVKRF